MKRILLCLMLIFTVGALPLLAQEELLTKLYFDGWLQERTTPLAREIERLRTVFDHMEITARELKGLFLTEIKIIIGQKTAWVDGTPFSLDVAPLLSQNRTMVPVRFIGEVFGAEFSWDEKTRKVTFALDGVTIELYIENKTAKVNGQSLTLDSKPTIIEGRTMVPLRFVGEYMGASLDWEDETQTALIYR